MRLCVLTFSFGLVLAILYLVVNAVVSELTGWRQAYPGAVSGVIVVAVVVAALAWWSNRVLARRTQKTTGAHSNESAGPAGGPSS